MQRRVSQVLGNAICRRPGTGFVTKFDFSPLALRQQKHQNILPFEWFWAPIPSAPLALPRGLRLPLSLPLSLSLVCQQFLRANAAGSRESATPDGFCKGGDMFSCFCLSRNLQFFANCLVGIQSDAPSGFGSITRSPNENLPCIESAKVFDQPYITRNLPTV